MLNDGWDEWQHTDISQIHCADFPALMQTLRSMEQCSTDIEAAALLGGLLQYSNSLLEGVRSDRRPQGAMQMNERLAALLAARDPGTSPPYFPTVMTILFGSNLQR